MPPPKGALTAVDNPTRAFGERFRNQLRSTNPHNPKSLKRRTP
jgi:hypothetical protein